MNEEKKLDTQKEKYSLLGEMFENIIHQFKQPLNAISTEASGIKFQHEMDMISDEAMYESLDNITQRTKYLAQTIDDFRDFLKEDKEKIIFKIKANIKKIESIIKPILDSKGIKLYKFFDNESVECNGYDREFSQVLINIINNAKDAIISQKLDEKIIKLDISSDENNIEIKIHDNAGGIPTDIIDRIFDDHFTTKEDNGGTGIGLTMSKKIIEKHFKGSLLASNTQFILNETSYYGACFAIVIPK